METETWPYFFELTLFNGITCLSFKIMALKNSGYFLKNGTSPGKKLIVNTNINMTKQLNF